MTDVAALFGQMDIYLFDQIQKGRIPPGATLLDAGCGGGRNLTFFLREGFEVLALDADERAIAAVRSQAARLAPHLPASNFRAEKLESSTFPEHVAEVVLSSAVLHFAGNEQHFAAMLLGSWRLLRPNGLFFCRLASSIGMPDRFEALGQGRYLLPDRSERFLVDEMMLLEWTGRLSATLLDPIKTTIVQNSRCMTTWVLRKSA